MRRFWVMTNLATGGKRIHRTEPMGLERATLTVRAKGDPPMAIFDGVWIDGQRAYDTVVIIDGNVAYHAPAEHVARKSFDAHEAAGGGRPL